MTGEIDKVEAELAIRQKFASVGTPSSIPLMTKKTFRAELVTGGVEVDNLGNKTFLPWQVFGETLRLLRQENGSALRGDAMGKSVRLGHPKLPLNSVEGHIAYSVYGKQLGDSVFRRISPVAAIMVWAGLCKPGRGELLLRD